MIILFCQTSSFELQLSLGKTRALTVRSSLDMNVTRSRLSHQTKAHPPSTRSFYPLHSVNLPTDQLGSRQGNPTAAPITENLYFPASTGKRICCLPSTISIPNLPHQPLAYQPVSVPHVNAYSLQQGLT